MRDGKAIAETRERLAAVRETVGWRLTHRLQSWEAMGLFERREEACSPRIVAAQD